MRHLAILSAFIFIFISKVNAFTFRECSYGNCYSTIYDESKFNANFINSEYNYDDIYINLTGESEITLNFDGIKENLNFYFIADINSKLTIQTNDYSSFFIIEYMKPSIHADELNVEIESLNKSVDKTYFVCKTLICKTIASKDPQKPLFLIYEESFYDNDYINSSSFSGSTVYADGLKIRFDQEIQESLIIILEPSIYTYFETSNYVNVKGQLHVFSPNNVNITYDENKILFEYQNGKTITIQSQMNKMQFQSHIEIIVGENSIIKCKEGLTSNEIIPPCLKSNYENNIKSLPTIEGNWSNIKITNYYDGYIYYYPRVPEIYGNFFFSANNYPIYSIGQSSLLILTERISSINFLYESIYNFNISLKNDVDTILYFNGELKEMEYGDEYPIYTDSSKLTIIANTTSHISMVGPATIIYRIIDNSENQVDSTLNFINGGTITQPYGLDYEDYYQQIIDIYDEYKETKPEPSKNATFGQNADYYIQFAKDKISDLSDLINNAANDIRPINIVLKDDPNNSNPKNNTIILNRKDFPVASLYLNALNKPFSVVCVEKGTIDPTKWVIKEANNILKPFFNERINSRFIPPIKNAAIKYDTIATEENKCIGINLTNTPASGFEIFVYTTGSKYKEILEKIDLINVLTPSDLDVTTKLKNKYTKNILLIVLNDLPDQKSFNLYGIRQDANVFLVGFKEDKIEDIFSFIQEYNDIYELYDYNGEPDGSFDSDKSDEMHRLRHLKQNNLISKFISQYKSYQPKAAVTFGTIQTLAIISVNYYGNHIKCTNLYIGGSTFSNLNNMAKDFSAQVTLVDSVTFKLISNLNFVDLYLFPVSYDPYNVFCIEEIKFTESQWTFKMRGYLDDYGMEIEDFTYTINTNNIRGNLYLASGPSECVYNVPNTNDKQKIKALSVHFDFYDSLNINNIPGIALLEEQNVKIPIINKILNSFKKQSTLLDSDDSYGVTFTGNWDKVEQIEGTLGIDTGSYPLIVKDMPTVVAQVIDGKSDVSTEFNTDVKDIAFSQPQIISQDKVMSFNGEDTKVTFTNLTFIGTNPRFSLEIDGQRKTVVTRNIVIDSDSTAQINGDLEVTESLEIGPGSSLIANSIKPANLKFIINYRFSSEIGSIPEGITPSSITFNYIGEQNLDVDVSSLVGKTINIMKFSDSSECQKIKDKSVLASLSYPDFRPPTSAASAICAGDNKATLQITVTKPVSGESQLPTDEVQLPSYAPAPGIITDEKPQNKGNKLGPGPIAGIVIGVIVFVAIVAVLIWYFVFHKKKDAGTQSSVGENVDENANED